MSLPVTLRLRANPEQVECCDCGRWAYLGESIRHGSRCDTGTAQAVAAPTRIDAGLVRDAKRGAASLHSDEAIERAVRCHAISMSDAMNRDF
jgi:hypothetical protein